MTVWDLKLIFSNTIKNWFIYEALFLYILQPTKKLSVAHDHVKLFLLGSYREFLVFSSNSGAVTNMHRTLKNGFHREQQYTLIFHRKKNYSRKNKNCQNFLKNSIESKLCLARCVTFWWEDALCEALRFHKETWEEK